VKAVSGVSAVRWTGLLAVAMLHLAVLKFLLDYRLLPVPDGLPSIFVDLIAPSPPAPPPRVEKIPRPPPQKPVERKPVPRQLVAEAPAMPTDPVAPEPPKQAEPVPVPVQQLASKPVPVGPLRMSTELALACPERRAPAYPSVSRRMGETGLTVVRVELSEAGLVAKAQVEKSSGHTRLDDAALVAVKTWKCNPPTREGRPVRAIALQPFNFVLEGV